MTEGCVQYEMECMHRRMAVVEMRHKHAAIESLRALKEVLRVQHHLKPFTALEENIAHAPFLSVPAFFALCVLSKLNVLLVCEQTRKYYEVAGSADSANSAESEAVHVVVRPSWACEDARLYLHASPARVAEVRRTYFLVDKFQDKLKAMSAYSHADLVQLCERFQLTDVLSAATTKKPTKQVLYAALSAQFPK